MEDLIFMGYSVPTILNKISQATYYHDNNKPLTPFVWNYDIAMKYKTELYNYFDNETINYFIKQNNAYYERQKRLRLHVMYLLQNLKSHVYFLTLTFDNENQSKKSSETKRRQVGYFLKSIAKLYISNVDYGDENNTLHYHALVSSDIPLKTHNYRARSKVKGSFTTRQAVDGWDYGLSDCQPVNEKNDKALTKYINKFTNHSKKASTHLQTEKILYSRGFPKNLNEYDNTALETYDLFTGELTGYITKGELAKRHRLAHTKIR